MKARDFVNISSLEDMASDRTRLAIASHAAKLRRQKRRRRGSPRAAEDAHSFLPWLVAQDSDPPTQPQDALQVAPLRQENPPLLSVLGQGRKDPFDTFTAIEIPEIVHELVDHGRSPKENLEPSLMAHVLTLAQAVHHFWAGLSPGIMPNPKNPAVTMYLKAIQQAPLAFYAYMVGTAENYELLSGASSRTKGFSQLCLSYRIEMIKLVNEELQSMSGPPSDNLLGAIVVLAANYVLFAGQVKITSLEDAHASRFRSPLRTAQFIHIYTSRPFRSPHSEALVRLVGMKGGCSKIQLPGVASTVELSVSQSFWSPFAILLDFH